MTLRKPKELIRLTLDKAFDGEALSPSCGVYILAYMGQILYVGKSQESVFARLYTHVTVGDILVDSWLRDMEHEFRNIRLDVLVPDFVEEGTDYWLRETEAAPVRQFNPLFNVQLSQ